MGLFDLFKKAKSNNSKPQDSPNVRIVFDEKYFEQKLDMIMEFLDAYSAVLPNSWYHLSISQEFEYASGITDGNLRFEILLDQWWDGLLSQYPDVDDYMKLFFTFDPQENKFTLITFPTGRSIGCKFPKEKIGIMLQSYLDNYELKHPKIHFERYDWGAMLTKKL